jgi:hypothetical protein
MAVLAVALMATTRVVCQTNTQIQENDSKLIVNTNWIYPSPQYRYIGKTLHTIYSAPFQCVVIPDDVTSYLTRLESGPASDTSEHDITLSVKGSHFVKMGRANWTTGWDYTFNNYPYFRYGWKGEKPVPGTFFSVYAVLVKEHINYINDGNDISHIERVYECGTPMTQPICTITTNTLGQLKRLAQQKSAKASDNKNRVLKYNQDLADKGDEYGLLRMGERYRDGDGVPKDLAKAKDYLTRAAAAGSPTAADELKALPGD